VETLVVVGIVLVLSGVVLSVFLLGKDRAKVVVDMSNLHQLGLAAAIYASDYDGVHPLSVLPLLRAGQIDTRLVTSPTDESDKGLAIVFRSGIGLPTDEYESFEAKITYIGPGEGDWTNSVYEMMIKDRPNQGWLVDLTRGERDHETGISMTEGPYRRLLFDTSVVTRRMGTEIVQQGGQIATKISFDWYFADR
jgi:type II secretory pathway pseudopilin PulG